MKLKLILDTPNYCATVVKVNNLIPLAWCDNVVWFSIFGFQAIVSKDTKIGDYGIIFTAETQLSEDFCKKNNLYRHAGLNDDPTQKGYVEDNRRVKAMKFRGHRSSALFMPLQSLLYIPSTEWEEFEEWVSFNHLNGVEVCKKYVVHTREGRQNHIAGKTKKFERIDCKTFPEHLDSDNYFRNAHMYQPGDQIIVTQKLHGTSGRFGNVKVRRKLWLFEKILKKLWVKISEIEYDYIAGSRRVIKDAKSEREFTHYYSSDVWNEMLEKIKTLIPKDYIIYGEIVGWTGEKPIQKGYTYKIPKWENELYIYRISIVNDDGVATDLSWSAILHFCEMTGLKAVPTFEIMTHEKFEASQFLDKIFSEMYPQALPLDPESPCDEWVCLRRESLLPYITKAKSPNFFEFESKQLDTWEEDIESLESNTPSLDDK